MDENLRGIPCGYNPVVLGSVVDGNTKIFGEIVTVFSGNIIFGKMTELDILTECDFAVTAQRDGQIETAALHLGAQLIIGDCRGRHAAALPSAAHHWAHQRHRRHHLDRREPAPR